MQTGPGQWGAREVPSAETPEPQKTTGEGADQPWQGQREEGTDQAELTPLHAGEGQGRMTSAWIQRPSCPAARLRLDIPTTARGEVSSQQEKPGQQRSMSDSGCSGKTIAEATSYEAGIEVGAQLGLWGWRRTAPDEVRPSLDSGSLSPPWSLLSRLSPIGAHRRPPGLMLCGAWATGERTTSLT